MRRGFFFDKTERNNPHFSDKTERNEAEMGCENFSDMYNETYPFEEE